MKLGFIGFGEASANIVKGLVSEMMTEIIIFDADVLKARSQLKQIENNSEISVASAIKDVVLDSDIIFSVVPGRVDKDVFELILKNNIKNKLFVDMCTVLPEVKKDISVAVENAGNKYVDVAVMGSVPKLLHKVPMLVSGSGASDFLDAMKEYNMNISIIGDNSGDASIIKLCRSIYMKGLAALLIELDEVSSAYGVKNEVFESIANSMDSDDFISYTNRLIHSTKRHCIRRMEEIEDCIIMIRNKNLLGAMTEGTKKVYDTLIKNKQGINE